MEQNIWLLNINSLRSNCILFCQQNTTRYCPLIRYVFCASRVRVVSTGMIYLQQYPRLHVIKCNEEVKWKTTSFLYLIKQTLQIFFIAMMKIVNFTCLNSIIEKKQYNGTSNSRKRLTERKEKNAYCIPRSGCTIGFTKISFVRAAMSFSEIYFLY